MTLPRLIIHLVVVSALVVVGPAAVAAPPESSEATPAPSPSPTAEPTASPSPTPTTEPSSSPSPSPTTAPSEDDGSENSNGGNSAQAQPSPAPTPTPSPTPTPAPSSPGGEVLSVVSVDRSMAQVGDTLTYVITLRNPGTASVSPTATITVPDEVLFLSATAQPGPSYGAGSLTWTATDLAPGGVRSLTWQGRVTHAGDLDAVSTVTVPGSTTPSLETHTYLARVEGIVLHRSPGEPDWGTHQERKVVFRTVTRPVSGAPNEVASSAGGVLPLTGAPVLSIVFVAALLIAGGCMLATNRARRVSAVALLVVLVAAACTSDAPPRDQTTESQDQNDEGDEVLGTRLGNDDNANDGDGNGNDNEVDGSDDAADGTDGDGTGAEDQGTADPDDDDATDGDPVAAPDATTEGGTEEVTTRDVVLVEVPNEAPAPRALGPSSADNEIFLDWDAASRTITGASSRAIFRADSPIQFLTSLDDGRGRVSAEVTLTNVTDAERLLVGGHFVLSVSGAGGSFQLSSPSLEQVLDPGDEVSAAYEFALPSGSYQIVAEYVTR